MLKDDAAGIKDLVFIKSAYTAWCLSAALLLPATTLILHCCKADYALVAYASSALSFLCSAAAGAAAQRKRGGGALYTGALVGMLLIVSLLTLGFTICGDKIDADSVISVASFSLAGAFSGAYFGARGKKTSVNKAREKGKKSINIIKKNNFR